MKSHQTKGHIKDVIKKAAIGDAEILAMLAIKMWPDHDPDELAEEFSILIRNIDAACFFKYIDNRPVAFAQCQTAHRSDIWKEDLFQKNIEEKDMLLSYWKNVRSGQKRKAVCSLPVTVSLITLTV